jgi:hypothetical protein
VTGTWDFSVNEGTDWSVTLTWLTGTPPVTPVDLTGYSAHMQIRSSYADSGGTTYADLSTGGGGIVLGGTAGTIMLSMSHAVTSALAFGAGETAAYDLKLTSPSGGVSRLLQGAVLLSLQVTA